MLGGVVEGGVEVTFYLSMCQLQVLFADGKDELVHLLVGFFGGDGGHGEGGSWYFLQEHQVIQAAAHFVAYLIVGVVQAGWVEKEVINAAGVV